MIIVYFKSSSSPFGLLCVHVFQIPVTTGNNNNNKNNNNYLQASNLYAEKGKLLDANSMDVRKLSAFTFSFAGFLTIWNGGVHPAPQVQNKFKPTLFLQGHPRFILGVALI